MFVPRAPARVGAHVSLGIVSFRLDAARFRASGIRVSQNALLVPLTCSRADPTVSIT